MCLLAVISALEEIAREFLNLAIDFFSPLFEILRRVARPLSGFLASPTGGVLVGHVESSRLRLPGRI